MPRQIIPAITWSQIDITLKKKIMYHMGIDFYNFLVPQHILLFIPPDNGIS